MSDKWVCIEINTVFHHGDAEAVAKKIKDIFGKRFVSSVMMFFSNRGLITALSFV